MVYRPLICAMSFRFNAIAIIVDSWDIELHICRAELYTQQNVLHLPASYIGAFEARDSPRVNITIRL